MGISDDQLRSALEPIRRHWRSAAGLRDAAVLAAWFTREGEDHLLFTLRQDDLPEHGGEVSFPGGAREGDEDPLACALRETEEEIGLAAAAVTVLGCLPDVESIAAYRVRPFVGRIPPPDDLVIDPREVARLIEVPVASLRDEGRWQWRQTSRSRRPLPFFDAEGKELWGMTAILTRDLLARL